MSPDQRLLVYASISPVAFVVNVGSCYDVVSDSCGCCSLFREAGASGTGLAGLRPLCVCVCVCAATGTYTHSLTAGGLVPSKL